MASRFLPLHLSWRMLVTALIALAIAITGVLSLSSSAGAVDPGGDPSGDGVDPVYVAGNPSCSTIGYGFGFKINLAPNGTFTLTNPPGELTGGAPSDPFNSVTISNSDGTYFDWSATLGIDAVIVKGGPNANAFVYIPEDMADTDLHAPVNPENNQYYGISHIEFCYDYELTATKTANATYTRTYTWTIDKSVSPDTWDLFTGDSGTSDYDVFVDQTAIDSDFVVSGDITVNNPTPFSVSFSVSDSVGGTDATVNCLTNTLDPGDSTSCSYSASLGGAVNGTNTATITSNTANVGGATASADYTFGDPTTVVGYPTINVSDSVQGPLGPASGDTTFEYSRTFTCDGDEGLNNNTATIDETGQSDDASVMVNCYALAVTKDVDPSFDRDWEWTIEKSADQSSLLLSEGQLFQVNYEVTVSALAVDSNHEVTGTISVDNPAPIDATINSVNDIVSPGIAATVDCGVTFPYTLPAGGTLTCTYSADLPDGEDRTNTATATLQNYSYDAELIATPSGTTDFSFTANVSFGDPTTETDECIDVSDTHVGFLGTVCAGAAPQTFTYSLWFGADPDADVVLECGDNTHVNVASFETNDPGATGSSSWTVNANVACGAGCTLTPGYWKTHSSYGPAPEDAAWFNLGDADGDGVSEGPDETFYLSGQSYYEVLWTEPAGNAYYILAHAYIAAQLNVLDGASSTAAVDAALDWAETFFMAHEPADSLSKSVRAKVVGKAEILDSYNNGLIGPGHCSE